MSNQKIIINGNFTKKNKKPISNREYTTVFHKIVKDLENNGFYFSGDLILK